MIAIPRLSDHAVSYPGWRSFAADRRAESPGLEAPNDKVNMGNWYLAYRDSGLVQHDPEWKLFLGRWERARRLAPLVPPWANARGASVTQATQ